MVQFAYIYLQQCNCFLEVESLNKTGETVTIVGKKLKGSGYINLEEGAKIKITTHLSNVLILEPLL